MDDLRYPIGQFRRPKDLGPKRRAEWIDCLDTVPTRMREAVAGLTDAQLDTPYRPGGWTVRQVVHHVPDSHMNSYVRFKWALTEDNPLIKTYDEKGWAELPEAKGGPIEMSLDLLEALHRRWVAMFRGMSDSDFARTLKHPELGDIDLAVNLAGYAHHSDHHIAHITRLREREGF